MALDLSPLDIGDFTMYTGSLSRGQVTLKNEDGSDFSLSGWTGFTGYMRRDSNATPFTVSVSNNNGVVVGQIIITVTAAQLAEAAMKTEGGMFDVYATAPGRSEPTALVYSTNVIVLDNASIS